MTEKIFPSQKIRRKIKTEQNLQRRPRRSEQLYGSIRKNINMARMEIMTETNAEQHEKKNPYKNFSISEINSTKNNQRKEIPFYAKRIQKDENPKLSRIIESLRKSNEVGQSRLQDLKNSKVKYEIRGKQRYQYMMLEYHKMMQEDGPRSEAGIRKFVDTVSSINHFLAKLDPLVYIPLFQVGKILIVPEKKTLYHQQNPCNSFYIILWGQFKLKDKYLKKIKYCISGDSLRQEVVLQMKQQQNTRNVSLSEKSAQPRCLQTAKSLVISGVLEIKKEKYEKVRRSLAESGQKTKFNLIDKMLMWGYIKKDRLKNDT